MNSIAQWITHIISLDGVLVIIFLLKDGHIGHNLHTSTSAAITHKVTSVTVTLTTITISAKPQKGRITRLTT
uniref:Uncharacterized protein n=1 Tax=Arundo donax TaxID=35708 RepID=A0A0A9DMS6_ARUDO